MKHLLHPRRYIFENASPLIKMTISARGKTLGAAWHLSEERQITTKDQVLDELAATLGGCNLNS